MPGEMTYHEKSSTEASPLNRALPGYDTEDTVALLYEAALRKTFEEMDQAWHRDDDLQILIEMCIRDSPAVSPRMGTPTRQIHLVSTRSFPSSTPLPF